MTVFREMTEDNQMKRMYPGVTGIAGALTLAGALSLIAIMPAAAASPNQAFAAGATGTISAPPIGLATFPGTPTVTLAHGDIASLLTTDTLTDEADATDASSTVANVSAALTALATLTASDVSSGCTFDPNTDMVSGSTVLSSAQITLPTTTITLASSPAPNTVVAGLAGIATVTLNAQSTAGDGTLTVTAIQISLIGSTQTLSLGVSVCNAADLSPVPVLPGKTMGVTLGAAGVLGLAGAGLKLRRRRPAGLA
jgi:hypothetical protein